MMPAVRNKFSPPSRDTSISTMDVSPAAGPVTDSGERLMKGTIRPPATPATSPDTGGTPQAIAIPRQSGTATRKTTTPAITSCLGYANIELDDIGSGVGNEVGVLHDTWCLGARAC
jgi:hypothetical protein